MKFNNSNDEKKEFKLGSKVKLTVTQKFIDEDTDDEYAWRDDAEDGSEYGLDPKDFDDEDEYEDALEEAKYGWRDDVEDGDEYDLDPDDYETEEEYLEALAEAKGEDDEDTCGISVTIEFDEDEENE